MSMIQTMKSWIGALTDLGLMLLALGIVCALLVGGAEHAVLRQCRPPTSRPS